MRNIKIKIFLIFVLLRWPIYISLNCLAEVLYFFRATSVLKYFYGNEKAKFLGWRVEISLSDLVLDQVALQKKQLTLSFLNDYFNKNICISETEEFRTMMQAMKNGHYPKGCKNEVEIREYFDNLIAACKSIQEKGFITKKLLVHSKLEQHKNIHFLKNWPIPHEISVKIDENNKFIWLNQGLHRQAIAEFLKIKKIPIYISYCPKSKIEQYASIRI